MQKVYRKRFPPCDVSSLLIFNTNSHVRNKIIYFMIRECRHVAKWTFHHDARVTVRQRVNQLFVNICFHRYLQPGQKAGERRTAVRYRVAWEQHVLPTRRKIGVTKGKRLTLSSSRRHCPRTFKTRICHTWCVCRCRVAEVEIRGKRANSRKGSGGHLRLGHFVLSPPFRAPASCKEATYAPVGSSLYPRDCGCIVL